MKVASISGPKKLSVGKKREPTPDSSHILVQVSTAGICGSDIHLWREGKKVGLVMGHELCGTVVESHSNLPLSIHDRITVIPLTPCGNCVSCKIGLINLCREVWRNAPGLNADGGFAEYVSLRSDMVRLIPHTISDVEAAMIEPTAVAFRAIKQTEINPGDRVLIIGGGIIGLLCAFWVGEKNAGHITLSETNPARRKIARRMNLANDVIDATIPNLADHLVTVFGGGFDKCLDCVGVESTINVALQSLKPRGTLTLIGADSSTATIPTASVLLRELKIVGSIAYTKSDFDACIEMIARRGLNLERFVTATTGFEGLQGTFERLSTGSHSDLKVIFRPD